MQPLCMGLPVKIIGRLQLVQSLLACFLMGWVPGAHHFSAPRFALAPRGFPGTVRALMWLRNPFTLTHHHDP